MAQGYRVSLVMNKCRHELQGRRLGNKNYPTKSKFSKTRTHKLERIAEIKEIEQQLLEELEQFIEEDDLIDSIFGYPGDSF